MKCLNKKSIKLQALNLTGLLLLSVLFFGCATIRHGGKQDIPIRSYPSDAKIKVYRRTGELMVSAKTPYTATLNRGSGFFVKEEYRIVIEKKGYQRNEFYITANHSKWYLGGNCLFGGLVGWLIVDPATGAMWSLSPEQINVNLQANVSSIIKNDGLMIVLIEDFPEILKDKMKPVNS